MLRAVSALAAVLLLAGCSTEGGSTPPATSVPPVTTPTSAAPPTSSAPTSSAAPADPNAAYGLTVPKRITLTDLGTKLTVGAEATVAWEPAAGTVGVLRLQVSKVRKGDIADLGAFELDKAARTSTPYYVDAIATNVGRTDLGGQQVPLLLLTTDGTLVQPSSFETTFAPCTARPLASPYPRGATGPVCLVFLAPDHGTAAAVAFRPQAGYDPITWSAG